MPPASGPARRTRSSSSSDANKAGLGGNIEAIATSRRALLRPFRAPAVSSAFRLEYSTQLLPVIRPLAGGANDEAAINAVRIAGELGTRDAMAVLSAAIKDKRPAVRVVAAKGFEQTFVASRSQPAIVVRDASGVLVDLKTAYIAETEPQVADAIIAAMDAGVRTDPAVLTGVRAEAVKAISDRVRGEDEGRGRGGMGAVFAVDGAGDRVAARCGDHRHRTERARQCVTEGCRGGRGRHDRGGAAADRREDAGRRGFGHGEAVALAGRESVFLQPHQARRWCGACAA